MQRYVREDTILDIIKEKRDKRFIEKCLRVWHEENAW